MNSVIIGQSPDVSQNNFGQKSAEAKKDASSNDSFSVVFAETGGEEESATELSDVRDDDLTEDPAPSGEDDGTLEDSTEGTNPAGLESEAEVSKADAGLGDALLETQKVTEAPEDGEVLSVETEIDSEADAELQSTPFAERDDDVENGAKTTGRGVREETSGSLGAQSTPAEKTPALAPSFGQDDKQAETATPRSARLDTLSEGKTAAQGLADKPTQTTLTGGSATDERPHVYKVRLGLVPVDTENKAISGTGALAQAASKVTDTNIGSSSSKTLTPFEMSLQSELAKPTARPPLERGAKVETPTVSSKTKSVGNVATTQAASALIATPQANSEVDASVSSDKSAKDFTANTPGAETRGVDSLGFTTSPQVSQTALLGAFGLSQQNDAANPRMDFEMRLGSEAVGISQTLAEATFKPMTVPGNEIVQRIAAQLSEAFASKGERKVDVMLNPKELGKVKMQLATSEGGVRVMIHVERPETGDLMRRHIGELEKEFREMGFENISFSFSSDDSQDQSDGQDSHQSPGSGAEIGMTQENVHDVQTEQILSLGGSGLDMRV